MLLWNTLVSPAPLSSATPQTLSSMTHAPSLWPLPFMAVTSGPQPQFGHLGSTEGPTELPAWTTHKVHVAH